MTKFKMFLLLLVCQLGVFITFFIALYSIFSNQEKGKNILLAYDRLFNASANDSTVETMSKRAALAKQAGKLWGKAMCKFLNLFQKDHCSIALKD